MTKPGEGYFDRARAEAVDLLPDGLDRVLEIGCGAGATLKLLKQRGLANWTAGLELDPAAAAEARGVVDRVWNENIETFDPPIAEGSLDALLCLDVLEHLIDPWATLRRLVPLLRPGGFVVACLPNVRNFKVVLPLLLRGEFHYDPGGGLLDATHLRFFTRETAIALVAQAGLSILQVEELGIKRGKLKWWINRLCGGLLTDFHARQFLILARKPFPNEAS